MLYGIEGLHMISCKSNSAINSVTNMGGGHRYIASKMFPNSLLNSHCIWLYMYMSFSDSFFRYFLVCVLQYESSAHCISLSITTVVGPLKRPRIMVYLSITIITNVPNLNIRLIVVY